MVQKQNGGHFVLFFNAIDHWKTELLSSLDYFIYKHIFLLICHLQVASHGTIAYIKQSRLAKSSLFQWPGALDHWKTEQTPTIGIPNMFSIPAPLYDSKSEINYIPTSLR